MKVKQTITTEKEIDAPEGSCWRLKDPSTYVKIINDTPFKIFDNSTFFGYVTDSVFHPDEYIQIPKSKFNEVYERVKKRIDEYVNHPSAEDRGA